MSQATHEPREDTAVARKGGTKERGSSTSSFLQQTYEQYITRSFCLKYNIIQLYNVSIFDFVALTIFPCIYSKTQEQTNERKQGRREMRLEVEGICGRSTKNGGRYAGSALVRKGSSERASRRT